MSRGKATAEPHLFMRTSSSVASSGGHVSGKESDDFEAEQGSLDDPERPLKRICQAAIYYLLQNKLEKYTRTRMDEEAIHSYDYLPTELLFKIMRQLDTSTMCECRTVCSRWQQIADKLLLETEKLPTFKLSRLIITGLSYDALEFRRVNYDEQRSVSMIVSYATMRRRMRLSYSFPRLRINRIFLRNLNLTNLVVDFLCTQLSMCDLSSMTHLSLQVVDFWYANAYTLHRLLAPVAKYIEVLELCESTGMQEDSVTDAHLAQLNASKVRSVMIDGVSFWPNRPNTRLQLGDESLRRFAEKKNFPVLILDSCSVTTSMICRYTEDWFALAAESGSIRSRICTMRRCTAIKGPEFKAECQKRGLNCHFRRDSYGLMIYTVQAGHPYVQFTFTTESLDEEEDSVYRNPHKAATNCFDLY